VPKRILFIRFSSIGDIVLTTPVVRCVKKQLDAEVHYLVKEQYAPAIESNPYIDKIITIKEEVREALPILREQRFDWIADLHHNLRSFEVKRALKRPGASFPKLNVEKWLMTNFKIDLLPDLHIVDRYFKTVHELGVQNDGEGLDFFIPVGNEVDVTSLSEGKLVPGEYVCMAIGAGLPTKNLEDAQWLQLIKTIRTPCALLGGPDDAQRGAWLEAQASHCVNLAGRLRLAESASVIEQSQVLFTPDTGLMHIGAALKKPIISVWGNTIPEFGMYPYLTAGINNQQFEINNLPCRPCSKIGFAKCPRGHFRCMREQRIEDIAKAIEEVRG
jgi:ADP-heptose:LPS heptosyltransferase